MRVSEAAGGLQQHVELFFQGLRLVPTDHMSQVLAREVLLNQIGHGLVQAEVVDRGDVAMHQAAGDLGFAFEALSRFLVAGVADLDRHRALDVRIVALIDDREAARADLVEYLEFPDLVHGGGVALAAEV